MHGTCASRCLAPTTKHPWLRLYNESRGERLLAAMRFLWNATRGSRLAPWRSPYIRWRIETYSGLKAETMTSRDVVLFTWRERWQLLRFLRWTGEIERGKVRARE